MIGIRRRLGLAASLALALPIAGFAAVGDQQVQASFDLPTDRPVIEYRLEIGQLEVEDNAKWIKVFADGRGLVHVPAFMRGGGDYAFQMTPGEVEDLARFAVGKGLVDFDAAEVKREKAEVVRRFREEKKAVELGGSVSDPASRSETRQKRDAGLVAIYDAETTVVKLHLDDYRPVRDGAERQAATEASRVDREIRWHALHWEAEWFPEVEPLTRLAEVEERLQALFDRPDLMPAEGGSR